MKPAQIVVAGVALAAAGGAWLIMGDDPPPPVVVTAAPAVPTTEVLVASTDLPMGQGVKAGDLRWQSWPADGVPNGLIKKAEAPNALQDIAGSIVRSAFLSGEPIRREKLIKTDGTGFMSAILPSGMRAVAIAIDTRGATSAGGFVLPNDRVDIIRTYRDEEASKAGGSDVHVSETILTNVRVLAIGQNVQEKGGEKVVTGETATLELTPAQAEMTTLAQKVGQLSLALRSLADAGQVQDGPRQDRADVGVTVVRYGIAKSSGKQ